MPIDLYCPGPIIFISAKSMVIILSSRRLFTYACVDARVRGRVPRVEMGGASHREAKVGMAGAPA